jgi:magnesium-transporting ATPase (P-type)
MSEYRINLATPALLFSAISLLMLAFTNRFLALAALVRNLHAAYKEKPDEVLYGQIRNLRTRLHLIRWMQVLGIASLLLCVVSMFLVYVGWLGTAEVVFGVGLVLMIASLALSLWEIQISVRALDLQLRDIEERRDGWRGGRAEGSG